MEILDQFSLTFSNESSIYQSNTLYSFRTVVNPPIHFPDKKWEVALTKMVIPQTRYVFMPESEFTLTVLFRRGKERFDPIRVTIRMTSKFYKSVDALIIDFKDRVSTSLLDYYKSHPEYYDIRHGLLPGVRFEIGTTKRGITMLPIRYLSIPESIAQLSTVKVLKGLVLWKMLGFQNIKINQPYFLPLRANHPPAFNIESTTLSLLAPNLVKEQFVADQLKPILELLPYNIDSNSEFCIFHQRYPLYKPIIGGYINNIQLELTDLNNTPLYFESGKLEIVLHFRPCQTMIKS